MITLVQINFSEDHSEKILPIGILSVGSALKKRGFEVELVNINEKQIEETARTIVRRKPLYVGLSVMTGVQTRHSAQLSRRLKDLDPSIRVLWGGIHPSLLPEQCLSEDYIDNVIVGEGELTSIEFSEALRDGRSFEGIPGLGYKEEGRSKLNQSRPLITDLDEWRIDWSLINIEDFVYRLGKYERVIAYKASRGCPFGCGFCYNNLFNHNRWRTWSVKSVLEDIEFLKKEHGVDAIKFYDDNFFVDKKRALEILSAIKLPSHLEIRIDMFTEELAKSLSELEVFDMLIGLESGSDRILKMIDKNFTVERMIQGVKAIAKYGLHSTYSFIVGLPSETEDEFWQTIDLMYEIYKIHPRAGFTLGAYLPYPGSKMYDMSRESGFRPPESTEDWGDMDRFRRDFHSPWVDAQKVWIIRECYKLMSTNFRPFKIWFEYRIRNHWFSLTWDIYFVEWLAGVLISEKSVAGKILRRVYSKLRIS